MRVFRGVKNGRLIRSCSCTPGNALASQRSNFRENRLNFRPSSAAEKISIVCGTNNPVKSEMLSNRHTHTHTDTQTKYCNPRCASAPRVNYNSVYFTGVSVITVMAALHTVLLVSHSQTLAGRESLVNYPYKTCSNTHPNWGGR